MTDVGEIRRVYAYLAESRRRFLETFRTVGWERFAEDRRVSWGSMLAVFLHMLDVEEGWWQIALEGGALANTPDRKPVDYRDIEAVVADNDRVTTLTRARLARLSDSDLVRSVTFDASEPLTRRFDRIVQHAAVDEIAHLGEFVAMLWQIDVAPPFVDWLDFDVDPEIPPGTGAR